MPVQDVLTDLPHGFHNAGMSTVTVDLVRGSVAFGLELWTGDEDAFEEDDREQTRKAVLRFDGGRSLIVDPPSAGRRFSREEGVDISGGSGDFPGEPPRLPDAPMKFWAFVETWDARILLAADDCVLSWLG